MLELRTLGGLDLRADGVEIPSILSQPKRLGLLVYLATANGQGYRRRDTILPLFWPELDHERARAALRQAIYVLRRDLGEDVVRSRGEDELAVHHDQLWLDVTAFLQAVERGDHLGAADLYRGDFLDGFFVSGAAAEFDAWVSNERSRLRPLASRAAQAVAEAEAQREPAVAAVWIRRAVALAPDDESTVRWALQIFDRIGDRAGALQLYREFRERLVREYDAQPSTETKAIFAVLRESNEPRRHERGDEVVTAAPESGTHRTAAGQAVALVPPRRWIRTLIPLAVALTVIVLIGMRRSATAPATDLDRIFAAPVRVSGSDSSLNYLREGMLDLLAAKLAGGVGPRLVDPGVALDAWRRMPSGTVGDVGLQEARRTARGVGAGRLLLGSVVGNAQRLDLQATLYDVATGRADEPVQVSGSRDSLPQLVDRLAAGLSLRAAGTPEQQLGYLMSQSPLALQSYLSGKRLFRAGQYSPSLARYRQALELDSTFALAALAIAESQDYWATASSISARGRTIAWRWRTRLPPRDREFLRFLMEEQREPGPIRLRTKIHNWELAVGRFPDRPVAWFQYGDNLFHWGLMAGIPDAETRASNAFDRALALDSNLAPALEHRIWLAAYSGDATLLGRLSRRYAASSLAADRLESHRWRVASALGDSAGLEAIRGRFTTLPTDILMNIMNISVGDVVSLPDAESTLAVVGRRASTSLERFLALMSEHYIALERGQRRRAVEAIARSKPVDQPTWTDAEDRALVYDALYSDGDRNAAQNAAAAMSLRAARPLPRGQKLRGRHFYDLCAAAQWRLAMNGDVAYARQAVTRLLHTAEPLDEAGDVYEHEVCAAILRVRLDLAEQRPPRPSADQLDSLLSFGPFLYVVPRQAAYFTLAVARERQGDLPAALVAIRRREPAMVRRYLTTRLRETGRLSALTGDTVGAISAYRQYLALRVDPDSALIPAATEVRRALRALQ